MYYKAFHQINKEDSTNGKMFSYKQDIWRKLPGTKDGYSCGIYVFDANGKLLDQFYYGPYQNGNKNILKPVRRLSIDDHGVIWAINNKSIYRFENDNWKRVYKSELNKLYDLIHIVGNRKVLTTNDGVFEAEFNENNNNFTIYNQLESKRIFKGFYIDHEEGGYLYLPLQSQAILVFQEENGKFQFRTRLVTGKGVHSIYEDRDSGY